MYTLRASEPTPVIEGHFSLGNPCNPEGHKLTADSRSLRLDEKPWLPVMGEFHYARYPEAEWRTALLRMQAGGIDIVATYVFWIHHEEIDGKFDWSERRSLRRFVSLCGELDLRVLVRCGPWCHGEVRNGGLPDWLLRKGLKLRSDDPGYLKYAQRLYGEIAGQLPGLLWKEGGPVIGIQCENEYGGRAEHLLSLKRIAIEAGLDVPLYTRTGWPELSTPMPVGQLLPLFGGYPDGFWDRTIAEMPIGYRGVYSFTLTRSDGAIATDRLESQAAQDGTEAALYPYFACEIGGGMERSYHRRIRIAPRDIEALSLVKIGSGSNLQGYYMYHGGTNPEGKLSSLQESQATQEWNDLPVKSYDFQAPLGEFGQVREHYHRLRRLHLFLHDFGDGLAAMPTVLPDRRPSSPDDRSVLRWSARTDGRQGYVFICNYQRLCSMPNYANVQFDLCLADSCLRFPREPVTIPADTVFLWPFHMDLDGTQLVSATAQPICRLTDEDTIYVVFAETVGIPSEFVFEADGLTVSAPHGSQTIVDGQVHVQVEPSLDAAMCLQTNSGQKVSIILLDDEQSLASWKATLAGYDRLFLTRSALLVDTQAGTVRLTATVPGPQSLSVFPPLDLRSADGPALTSVPDGLFHRVTLPEPAIADTLVHWELVREAGPARTIENGSQGVAEAPSEGDFEQAAVWRLHLPLDDQDHENPLLRIGYVGDVARITLDGQLLTDNFYNGNSFDLGIARYAPEIAGGELLLHVLPLQKDAPIYLPADAWPEFREASSVVSLESITIVDAPEITLTAV